MNTLVEKTPENKAQSVTSGFGENQGQGDATFQFIDNRPEALAQMKLQESADNSNRVNEIMQLKARLANDPVQQYAPIQKQENKTGLPDDLKSGMESISGMSLSDVKVHRNSDKPAQLQAHAYAQGTDIHLGPGQEKHLPHELGHVVQQKQGRVKPTVQLKGKVNVNDDPGLEKEADVLGAKALQGKFVAPDSPTTQLAISSSNQPMQFAPPAQVDEPWTLPFTNAFGEAGSQLGAVGAATSEFLGSATESAGAATSEFLGNVGEGVGVVGAATSEFLGNAMESVGAAGAATSEFLGEGVEQILNYFQLINAVDPVKENEDVSGFFFDLQHLITLLGWELDAEAAPAGTSPQAEQESPAEQLSDVAEAPGGASTEAMQAVQESPAGQLSNVAEAPGGASTEAVEAEAEEEDIEAIYKLYNTYARMAGDKATMAADVATNTFGNGVVANAQGMVQTPDNVGELVFHDLTKEIGLNGPDVYTYLTTQDPRWNKLRDVVGSDHFGEANKYIALFAILRDATELVLLIKNRMDSKTDLTEEEKISVNALLEIDINSKVLDVLQGTAYGAGSIVGVGAQAAGKATEVIGAAGLMTQGAGKVAEVIGTAANAVPGLGIAASGVEFLRGGWKGIKAHERAIRLNEIIKEINLTPDDAAPGFAEFKSKMTPLMTRVKKRRFRNGTRSLGGAVGATGAGLVLGGAATAATGGGFLLGAAVIGTGLGAKMLWGQIRAKKEKRQELAEYLYKSSLQDDYTGSYAKRIVKGIIGKEELLGLPEKDLIALIARKIKSN